MVENRANNTIRKPYEASNGDNTTCYADYINEIMEKQAEDGYYAKYAIGVTFGVNLTKWRDILKAVFNREEEYNVDNNAYFYNDVKEFKKAVMITDPVYVEDNDKICQSLANNLKVILRGKPGNYLHTKFILIYLKNSEGDEKYILLVSSKNISNSSNFDIIIPLFSSSNESSEQSKKIKSGRKTRDYIEFLLRNPDSKLKDEDLGNCLNGLENVEFEVEQGEGEFPASITDFEIAYDKYRFSEDIWKKLLDSDIIISPYLSENLLKDINRNNGKKILSYQQTWNRVFETLDMASYGNLKLYVGAPRENHGRYKFHSKMYIGRGEDGKTQIYFGSANLTDEAKESHYEMLIGVRFDDNGKVYSYFNTELVNKKAGNIVEQLNDTNLEELNDFDDEAGEHPSRFDKYAVYQQKQEYIIKVFSGREEDRKGKHDTKIQRKDISNWVMIDSMKNSERDQVYICEDNYYKPDKEMEGYISYDDFKKIVDENNRKMKSDYYKTIFMEKAKKRKSSNNERGKGKTTSKQKRISPQYPCIFRMLQNENIKKEEVAGRIKEILKVQMDSTDEDSIVALMKMYGERK